MIKQLLIFIKITMGVLVIAYYESLSVHLLKDILSLNINLPLFSTMILSYVTKLSISQKIHR
jgi:hypothetical protein